MKKMILLLLLFLSACEIGKFDPERKKLYENSGWNELYQ